MKNPNEPRDTKYEKLGIEIGQLVDEKQISYGDSFNRSGEVLRQLYPDGIKPEQYIDMLAVIRIVDKLFRIANKKDAFGESPAKDICGYGLLMAERHDRERLDEECAQIERDGNVERKNR